MASDLAFQVHHIFPTYIFGDAAVKAALEAAGFFEQAKGNKIALFSSPETAAMVRAMIANGDNFYLDAGFGGSVHLGNHAAYNTFVWDEVQLILGNYSSIGDRQEQLGKLHSFLTDVSLGKFPDLGVNGDGAAFGSHWSSYDLTPSQIGQYLGHLDATITDGTGDSWNPVERFDRIEQMITEARDAGNLTEAQYLIHRADLDRILTRNDFDRSAEGGQVSKVGIGALIDIQRNMGTMEPSLKEKLVRAMVAFPGDEGGSLSIAAVDKMVSNLGKFADMVSNGIKNGTLPESMFDLSLHTLDAINTKGTNLIVGVGGGAIGDIVEFLNMSYEAIKKGVMDDDWSDFDQNLLTYGVAAVVSAFIVVGTVTIAGWFGAEIGAFVAFAWAAWGAVDAINNGIQLFFKIAADFPSLVDYAVDATRDALDTFLKDPLVLDLDGDGIELVALADSNVHFDLDGNGLAERTGWVSADDGFLVIDANGNGQVDGAQELFGSSSLDGFAVLETYDSNSDGIINELDAAYASLMIWQDADQDGVSDSGELVTLASAGIESISLTRTDVTGSNNGHGIGYGAVFTRDDSSTGTAQTIYFAADDQDTQIDNTPAVTFDEDVIWLPRLSGTGEIYSTAWKATTDDDFKELLKDFTLDLPTLDPLVLRERFVALLWAWADLDEVDSHSRGYYVDARKLEFVEKFFGDEYRELGLGGDVSQSPTTAQFGRAIEASFDSIANALLTIFLSQSALSLLRVGDDPDDAISSPYFFYTFLTFGVSEDGWPETPANLDKVLELIVNELPSDKAEAAEYLATSLGGLVGLGSLSLGFQPGDIADITDDAFASVTDPVLNRIATAIMSGGLRLGTSAADGIGGTTDDDVLLGGAGDDLLVGGAGSDAYLLAPGDGADYVQDTGAAPGDTDTIILSGLDRDDAVFERIGDSLIIRSAESTDKVIVDRQFAGAGVGIEQFIFADGVTLDAAAVKALTVTVGDDRSNLIQDTSGNDTLRAEGGHDLIRISGGNDTILYAKGDGFDQIEDTSGVKAENDRLVFADILPDGVELSRVGGALVIEILATGEKITDLKFFENIDDAAPGGWSTHGRGIDTIVFANGVSWNRATIFEQAWVRGNDAANSLTGSKLNDIIVGGEGRDYLTGREGNDTYLWGPGDGSDRIDDNAGSADRLVLKGVHLGGIRLSRNGDDLRVTVLSTGETIDVLSQFNGVSNLASGSGGQFGIEVLELANGVTLSRSQLAYSAGQSSLGKDFDTTYFTVLDEDLNVLVTDWWTTDEFGHQRTVFDMDVDFYRDLGLGYVGSRDIWSGYNAASDSYTGGIGTDEIHGRGGDDTLRGGLGDDAIMGDDGNDTLYGDFSSSVGGAISHDYLSGGNGNDHLYGGAGNDVLIGGAGNDTLDAGDGDDDLVDSGNGNDVFIGGHGDDFIDASSWSAFDGWVADGSDRFVYSAGDGNDRISSYSNASGEIDTLELTDINSTGVKLTRAGQDLLIRVVATDETVTAVGFFENFGAQHNSIDVIEFADSVTWDRDDIWENAWLRGGDSRDYLEGRSLLHETFIGGAGDDIMRSSRDTGWLFDDEKHTGDDTFIYAKGDGNDVIIDTGRVLTENDVLVLTDIDSDEVELSRAGSAILVRIIPTGQTITIDDMYRIEEGDIGRGIDTIQFADSVSWNRATILANAWIRGTSTKDTILSESLADDTFLSGEGDDYIRSKRDYWWTGSFENTGSDTYVYRSGDGNDTFDDFSKSLTEIDRLVLTDLNIEDLSFARSANDLLVQVTATDETIRISNFFYNFGTHALGMDRIYFADGTIWDREAMRYWSQEGSAAYTGNANAETLIGSSVDQYLAGAGGNDFIDGKGGADEIYGEGGNDTIAVTVAETGDVDFLDGGANTDLLDLSGFGAAVHADLVLDQGVLYTSDATTLAGGTERLIAELRNFENVTGTAFADDIAGDDGANTLIGGGGDDVLDGRSGDDTLTGATGNDELIGYLGNDTYVYTRGDGTDTFAETASSGGTNDRILLHGILPAAVSFARVGGNLIVTIAETAPGAGNGGQITLIGPTSGTLSYEQYGFDRFVFDDGTQWDATYLAERTVTDSATAADDTLIGNGASGTFAGGLGNDRLEGRGGSDLYVFNAGDGQDVIEDNGQDSTDIVQINGYDLVNVHFGYSGSTLVLTFAGSSDQLTITNTLNGAGDDQIEKLRIGSTELTMNDARLLALADASTSGNDSIAGFNGDDSITAGQGDDTIYESAGNDTYVWNIGDGHDTILNANSSDGTNTIELRAGVLPADLIVGPSGDSQGIVIRFAGLAGSITIAGQLTSETAGIDQLKFADGTLVSRAALLAGLPDIRGNGSANSLAVDGDSVGYGGAGNDTLTGVDGSTAYFRGDANEYDLDEQSDGSWIVTDLISGRDGVDHLVGIENIRFADGTFAILDGWADNEATVPENAPGGTMVGTVQAAVPPALVGLLSYELVDDLGGLFEIDTYSGEITVAEGADFDFDTVDHYDLEVRVFSGAYERFVTLPLDILEANGAPTGLTFLSPLRVEHLVGSATSPGGGEYRLTPKSGGQVGAVWGAVDLSHDVVWTTRMFFGSNDGGADGVGFALGSTDRLTAGNWSSYGVFVASTFGIRFDTYVNSGEPSSDFSQLIVMNSSGTLSGGSFHTHANIENNAWHDVVVNWDADTHTLSYSLDGSVIDSMSYDIATNLLGGATSAAFGFGAATGGASNEHRVDIVSIESVADGLSIDVGAAGGSLVGRLVAIDADGHESFTYQIVDENDDLVTDSVFEIVGDELRVKVGSAVPQDADNVHVLLVKITDRIGASTTIEVDVDINPTLTDLRALAQDQLLPPVLGGNAISQGSNIYRLTANSGSQNGAIWGVIDLAKDVVWTTKMYFGGSDGGADGIAFALTNTGRIGSLGSYGVSNTNSLGIRFDTYVNPGEPGSDFSQIGLNNSWSTAFSPTHNHANIENGAWHDVVISWDAASKTLSYSLDGVFVDAKSYDVATNLLAGETLAAFGFGASTGGATNEQWVQIISISTDAARLSIDVGSDYGDVVGTLNAVGRGGAVTYQIVDGDGDPVTDSLFEIVSGQIRVKSGVTIGTGGGDTHDIFVKATDAAGSSLIEPVGINIRTPGVTLKAVVDGTELAATSGADTFVFAPDFGGIEITGFVADGSSQDVLRFNHAIFDDWADVLAAAMQVGDDVVITANLDDVITLKDVQLTDLGQGDFRFT